MEVDTASSATQAPSKHPPAELEIYCYFILLLFLVDHKKYTEVCLFCVFFFFFFAQQLLHINPNRVHTTGFSASKQEFNHKGTIE